GEARREQGPRRQSWRGQGWRGQNWRRQGWRGQGRRQAVTPGPGVARRKPDYSKRFLKYESLTAILPCRNVKMSQPLTSIFLPSVVVPVKIHSETPRSPATKWRAWPKWASGKILNTFAKASRTRSRPS